MENNLASTSPTRKALGRGLAALIPSAEATTNSSSPGLRQLAIERIHANPTQPRKQFDETALEELASSIRSKGILQPIVVRRSGEGYEIVAGERRWRAASRAGLHEIPALVKELTDSDALQVALIENIQRQDLDPLEEAEAYGRLIQEHGLTHEQVAESVSKSRSAVSNSLRLLKLPPQALTMLADGRLTAGHARALMMLDKEADIVRFAEDIAKRKMSVRDAERRARAMKASAKKVKKQADANPSIQAIEERLQRALGTKVRLHHRAGKGRIEIFFHSLDGLDAILDRIP